MELLNGAKQDLSTRDTQTYGIDYMETFTLVDKINIVCFLLSLAVNLDWPLHQFDAKNAFLHGNLLE